MKKDMNNNTKTKHHYVWQYYLKSWAYHNVKFKVKIVDDLSNKGCHYKGITLCNKGNNIIIYNSHGNIVDLSDNSELYSQLINIKSALPLTALLKRHKVYCISKCLYPSSAQIFCFDKKGNNIFPTSTKVIGMEKDFYKLNSLTLEEVFFLKFLVFRSCKLPSKLLTKWTDLYESIFATQKIYDKFKSVKNFNFLFMAKEKFEDELIEDMHTRIEIRGSTYIHCIKAEDIDFIKNKEQRSDFFLFVCVQYLRTATMKSRIEDKINYGQENDKIIERTFGDAVSNISVTIKKHFNLIILGFALSIAQSLLTHKIILLKNNTQISFITCDQPIINLGIMNDDVLGIEKLELYYPISPQIAILIVENHQDEFVKIITSEMEINDYNDKMIFAASKHIYASSEEQINKIQKQYSEEKHIWDKCRKIKHS